MKYICKLGFYLILIVLLLPIQSKAQKLDYIKVLEDKYILYMSEEGDILKIENSTTKDTTQIHNFYGFASFFDFKVSPSEKYFIIRYSFKEPTTGGHSILCNVFSAIVDVEKAAVVFRIRDQWKGHWNDKDQWISEGKVLFDGKNASQYHLLSKQELIKQNAGQLTTKFVGYQSLNDSCCVVFLKYWEKFGFFSQPRFYNFVKDSISILRGWDENDLTCPDQLFSPNGRYFILERYGIRNTIVDGELTDKEYAFYFGYFIIDSRYENVVGAGSYTGTWNDKNQVIDDGDTTHVVFDQKIYVQRPRRGDVTTVTKNHVKLFSTGLSEVLRYLNIGDSVKVIDDSEDEFKVFYSYYDKNKKMKITEVGYVDYYNLSPIVGRKE